MSRNASSDGPGVVALPWPGPPARAGRRLGAGAGDSLGDPAGPMQMGLEYSGAFKSDNDLDHVLFSVANPARPCSSWYTNTYGGCGPQQLLPIWGTLLDTAGGQLGGEGCGAGTGPWGADQRLHRLDLSRRRATTSTFLEGNGDPATYRFRADRHKRVGPRRRRGRRRSAPAPPRSPACTRRDASAGQRSGPS
jgi:hypothetical protein